MHWLSPFFFYGCEIWNLRKRIIIRLTSVEKNFSKEQPINAFLIQNNEEILE
jgi:hypothetical protein